MSDFPAGHAGVTIGDVRGDGLRRQGWLSDDRASVATEYVIVVSVLLLGFLVAIPIVLAAVRRHYLTVVDWTALPFP